jgi:hypothetical protein
MFSLGFSPTPHVNCYCLKVPKIEEYLGSGRTNRMCFYCQMESSFLYNPNAGYENTKKKVLAKLTPAEQRRFEEQPPNDTTGD